MRVLHIVTLVDPTGAFGGPLRVALNQATELRRRGHDVHLAAGWVGGPPPTDLEGVPAHLFRSRRVVPPMGFSGMFSAGLVPWLVANARSFDAVHVHAGRDMTTVSAMTLARLRGVPYVAQTHGMVPPDQRAVAKVLDALATRRLLTNARRRFTLNDRETLELQQFLGPDASLTPLMNGLLVPPQPPPRSPSRPADVLFCARLHPRKRPAAFVKMARLLRDRGVDVTFGIVGPDEGELAAVLDLIRDLGLDDVVRYEGALSHEHVQARLARCDVYVLPSVDEPFPMSLLEALSLGVPSVCTDSCGIADVLRESRGAVVTTPDPPALAEAVSALLADPVLLAAQAQTAYAVATNHFSIASVVDTLEREYAGATAD
jgi:glycosyltransferase involved in cell wall biosynthesis